MSYYSTSDELGGCLFSVIGLALVGVAIAIGGMLLTSHAVLYGEYPLENRGYLDPYFECHYFTGLRNVEKYSMSDTGCERFIKVGE